MNVNALLHTCHSWSDFKNKQKGLSTKQRGDSFEALTKYYLQLSPKYMSQLGKIWLLREVPVKVREHLNLPGPDEGIDLVAETKDGDFWAIQCKYLEAESTSLSRTKLSTFLDLSFNICRHVSFCLICSPADQFSSKFQKYGSKVGFCLGEDWRALDNEFFTRLRRTLDRKSLPLKPSKPRPHQQQAIQGAYQYFVKKKELRGKLIMPCGTGKSLVGYWIAEKLRGNIILIAVPSLSLLRQTLEVWAKEMVAHRKFVHWIAVCSDKSVGTMERDDVMMHTQDLGIQVHTDSKEIARWLKTPRRGKTVVFTTYQSGEAIAQAARKSNVVFDVGIMDEAHKTVGAQDSLFSHLLHDTNISIKKRVFMTATERRYLGQSDAIASMDDIQLYGETFHLLSFKKALEARPPILCDYKIITISVTRQEVSALIKKNVFVKPDRGPWDNEVEAEMLAGIIALRKAMQKWPIRHAVSFHSRIARAQAFQNNQDIFGRAFPDYPSLDTFHVFGQLPTSVRSHRMEAFSKAKRSLVTNARCLTEGVDVPNIDCVLFADPKKSTIDIVQAVGRAMRTFPGKQCGHVIVPVLLDEEVNEGEMLDRNVFTPILTVLRALAANDKRIIEYFRGISQGRQAASGRDIFNIDIPLGLKIDADSFVNSVHLKLWPRLAKLSWRSYDLARHFVHQLGLHNQVEWKDYSNGKIIEKPSRPSDIPKHPQDVYKSHGWVSWGDWLGTGFEATRQRQYQPYHQAREYIHGLRLQDAKEWRKFCKGMLPEKGQLPKDVPANPNQVYKTQGWTSWGDWLGTGYISHWFRHFRSFKEARAFVHSLNLKSRGEWGHYCRGKLPQVGKLPEDIPKAPDQYYKDKGWISMGDWLGTGTIAPGLRQYLSFNKARAFARKLGLQSSAEWRKFCRGQLPMKEKLPEDIPFKPDRVYKKQGWVSFGDWLGTGYVAHTLRRHRQFKQAREFVHKLGLKNQSDWREYSKGRLPQKGNLPEDIPKYPNQTYKENGWISWGDWFGTGYVASQLRKYRPFKEARRFVRSIGLESTDEWWKYCRGKLSHKGPLPKDIPAAPERIYKAQGWAGMGDWIGTGTIAPHFRQYRSFMEARLYVHRLKLKSNGEWRKFCKGEFLKKGRLPEDIPVTPDKIYKTQGWTSWGDWLGTGTIAPRLRQYRSFKEARAFVCRLGLQNEAEWRKFRSGKYQGKGHLPEDIPSNPNVVYKRKDWVSWPDWLGKSKT